MSSKSSKSKFDTNLPDAVVVGRVLKPHGVRGEVVVEVISDVPGRFRTGAKLVVSTADGQREVATIAAVGQAGSAARIKLEGVEDRDTAETLRGALFEVQRGEVPSAPDGSYYYFELVGCHCHDEAEGDLGRVVEILEDGGGLLLKVESEHRQILLPFVKAYLRQVDIPGRRIEFCLPEGLIETCGSRS
jgi:16S rRNA processing protein RimM